MEEQNSEINTRLDRYLELREETETEPSQFDSLTHLYGVFDRLSTANLYVCERKNVCLCKGDCMCDSDNYSKVLSTELINASNNTLIIRFGFHNEFKTSQMQGIRFFTLDEKTDEEAPVVDICKSVKKDSKKRRYVDTACMVVDGKTYDIDGNPRINRGDLCVSVNYMYWV